MRIGTEGELAGGAGRGRAEPPPIHVLETVPHLTQGDILRHPDFDAACARLVDGSVALYGGDRRLTYGLREFGRLIAFVTIIGLDAASDPGDPSSLATLDRLQAHLATMGLTNRRSVADLVTKLERDGFLLREPSAADRRVHVLRPSEKMRAADREWIEVYHAPLAMLGADPARYAPALAHDPRYQLAFRRAALLFSHVTNRVMASEPGVALFLGHKIGIRVLMALMQAVRGRAAPRTPPGFYTAAAELTGASRVHVRNLMREAAALGLLDISDPPGLFVELRQPFLRGVERWIAASLSAVDLTCSIALAEAG